MTPSRVLPEGLVLTRTTDVFDNDTVPAGLLRAHRVADGPESTGLADPVA